MFDEDLVNQGCGSGFNDYVDPDPYRESGSRGKKKLLKLSGNVYFLYVF
jgi:hypothetical protein